MAAFPFSLRCSCGVLVAVAGSWWCAASALAQQQEGGLLDRINHPDRTLRYDAADKQFGVASAAGNRQASVHAFTFGNGGTFHSGDGAFRTKAFGAKDGFRTQGYSTRVSPAGGQGFNQTDKTFGTKSVDVREDPAANKVVAGRDREYAAGTKPFLGRGKRQDTIDDLRKQKNLTIDQVREILNKNK